MMMPAGADDEPNVDRKLVGIGSALQRLHRHDGDEQRCAAGCDGPQPCRGHRLGSHVLEAANGPWHARLTVWADLVSSGALTPSGTGVKVPPAASPGGRGTRNAARVRAGRVAGVDGLVDGVSPVRPGAAIRRPMSMAVTI
ncbi:hypothetical protein [Dactylosporangium sp. CA-233914]|uniref:hypothetical protein n=1 Tax=Dactylosporangium sp. CA-233914 TaxID=3239934 RepID=UPI003D8AC047